MDHALALTISLLDRYYGFRVQHLFIALFLLSPLAVIFSSRLDRREMLISSIVTLFTVIIIVVIEGRTPYYFEMSG